MSVINIRKAQREGARMVLGLAGQSGDGKTLTALYLAWGLANYDSSKVGFLDTENRRGSLYANSLQDANGKVHEFLIGDLYPPFTPERYSEAIQAFVDAGVEVLVIDSVTHEWEGTGGCEEIARSTTKKTADWLQAKARHKGFVNQLLQSPLDVICCIRAREKTDFTNPARPQSMGVQPIQEKNFMFEMTASLMMHDKGWNQTILKCPEELLPILGRQQGYIGPQDGKALREWRDGGKKVDQKLATLRDRLQQQTEQGEKHLHKCWKALTDAQRNAVGEDYYATLTQSARAYDDARETVTDSQVDDLNSELGSIGGPAAAANTDAPPAADQQPRQR
jgi:hypothetical protein